MSEGDAATLREIREFLSQYLDCAEAGDEDDLVSGGYINSLFAMQIVLFVEQRYGLRLAMRDLRLAHFSSIGAIARLVGRRRGDAGHDG